MKFEKGEFLDLFNNNSDGFLKSPSFTILLKKDQKPDGTYESYGSLTFLRQDDPLFDIKLFVEAQAELDFTIDLGGEK